MGLDKFKIHPSTDANFNDWVSFAPTSKTSSMGRRMNMGKKNLKVYPMN